MTREPDGAHAEAWRAGEPEMVRLLERCSPRPDPAAEARIREAVLDRVGQQTRPKHLRLLIAAYALCGLLLLALAALGLAGAGPLAF